MVMSGKNQKKTVKVALVQSPCGEDTGANLQKAASLAEKAAKDGAQIVCLQELYRSTYFCQAEQPSLFDLAEPVPGPSTDAFTALAKKHNVVVIVPIFEKRAAGVYHNSAVVIDADGSILGIYRKMHIPHDPLFFEKYYFAPGDTGFKVFNTKYGRIAVLICWDQWFPEGARLASLAGAQILFYPTAIGWLQDDTPDEQRGMRDAWQTIQRAHAIANGLFVAAPNRVGKEGRLTFWGSSFVSDPFGRILAQGGQEEEIVHVECDLALIEKTRRLWPFLRDRRIDAYGGLVRRFLDEE